MCFARRFRTCFTRCSETHFARRSETQKMTDLPVVPKRFCPSFRNVSETTAKMSFGMTGKYFKKYI
jgi:hypothetical protein